MPFTKGHPFYPGGEKGWFKKGLSPHNKGKIYPHLTGDGSCAWKGEDAKYTAKHMWLRAHHGAACKCENEECAYPRLNTRGVMMAAPKQFYWANISNEYKRLIEDWMQLCASCHQSWDRGLITIRGIKKIPRKDIPYWRKPKP